jgi:DNA invertase Pin-like site-specific DNA recombinase
MARKNFPITPVDAAELAQSTGATNTALPLRAAIYVRVSSTDQLDGFSLDAQLRSARDYCAQRGWIVAHEYAEEGKSARPSDLRRRPEFSRLLTDADGGAFDVVVVHKLDRFARNVGVLMEAARRLTAAATSLVSITENLDYTNPQGKLVLTMLGALAEFYSDNLGQEVKKGFLERSLQGLHNGLLPLGAMAGPDGFPVPDTRSFTLPDGRTTSNFCSSSSACVCRDTAAAASPDCSTRRATGRRATGGGTSSAETRSTRYS